MNDRARSLAVTTLLVAALAVVGGAAIAGTAAGQTIQATDVSLDNGPLEDGESATINVTLTDVDTGSPAAGPMNADAMVSISGPTSDSGTTGTVTVPDNGSAIAQFTSVALSQGDYTVDAWANSTTNGTVDSTQVSTTFTVQPTGFNAQINPGDRVFHGDNRNLTLNASNFPAANSFDEFQTEDGVDLVTGPVPWDLNDGEAGTFYPQGDSDLTGQRIVLRPPTPQRIHLYDERGNRLSPGEAIELGSPVTIALDYRAGFLQANHSLDFTAYEDNVDVTTELREDLDTTVTMTGYDEAWELTPDETGTFDIGTQPNETVIFDGEGYDNQFDRLRSLRVVDDDQAELELDVDSAYQGERVRYEISPASQGDHFLMFIDANDLRRPNQFADHRRAFRLDDDAIERGVVVDDGGVDKFANVSLGAGDSANLNNFGDSIEGVYAIVERDDTATSRIATQHLDDGDVDLELYAGVNENDATTPQEAKNGFLAGDDIDDRTLTVDQGEITINQPPTTYVPGTQVDINGTTTEGMDDVQVYIRDRDNFEFLTEITVADGEYEETSLELNRLGTPGSDILGLPGSYRYGVIDKEDVEVYLEEDLNGQYSMGHIYNGSINLESNAFNRGASTAQSIRVADPTLDASIETYNGEVYRDDGLYLSGELVGPRNFAILATDAQGNTMYEEGSADRRTHEIDEDALPLESVSGNNLRSGTVDAIVLSPGRDQLYGDGVFTVSDTLAAAIGWPDTSADATTDALEEVVQGVDARQLTRTQVRELLLADTVEEAGSDDLFVADSFRVASDARTEINAVVPTQLSNLSGVHPIEHGETMVIRGTTNRNPDQTLMVVEATEGPDEGLAAFPSATTEEWGFDGVWSVEIPITEEVVADTYTVEVEDGVSTDQVTVEIVGEGEAGERQETDIDALQQQIQDLQDEVEALQGERDELQDRIAELEEENEQLRQERDDLQDQLNETGGTGEEQPGFTVVAALLSLIAVALLAMRRREE